MKNYSKSVKNQCHKKIFDQLENSIFQIKGNEGTYGIGFFSYIKCQKNKIPVVVANYKIINEEYLSNNDNIEVLINNKDILIELGNIKYFNKFHNFSIIEIKEIKFKIDIKFLELDVNMYEKEPEIFYYNESIYIIHYNNEKNI